LLYITGRNSYNSRNNGMKNAEKRDSKPGIFTYREPGTLRMGFEKPAEQALEHCTEQVC
jgi:hypothetical protein